ncbi:metallophosphoesterase [Butyrivibrio fibrisolvens]|uniref:metallophosphoesterase n=1 Tax=Butyrivibrio fibrisolvens TaxID=831 RepID=UPI0004022F9A|nr:metallophosphoesterase [Butyrivibrio fibrisolvens]
MKALVIPDIHLKPWIFDRASEILKEGKAERAVCLMDIPDDWGMELSVEQYRDTFDRAISFAEAYPETLWCYGNHDVSYPWGKLETGYSPYAERTVISKLDELKDSLQKKSQIAFIHRIDNVLFMHGGLTAEYVSRLNPELLDADIDEVLEAVNSASDKYLWNDESPLWYRPQYKDVEAFRKEIYTQVIGHTSVKEIYEKNGFISTDVFSTYSDGRQIGESAMISIDTEARKYEKVPVMGKLGYKVCTVTVDEEETKTC